MTPKKPLIRGSLAIDTILLHRGTFEARILPHEISRLNVSFGIDESKDEFGGTAGNIAYGCHLLEDMPLVNACIGSLDNGAWSRRIHYWGLDASCLREEQGERGPRAYILTDSANNQICGFHPGAMRHSAKMPESGFDFAFLAPDSAASMSAAATELSERSIPYFLDPGQALPSLLEGQNGADFKTMLARAHGFFVNDYEALLCSDNLGETFETIAEKLPFCVRTLGAKGCEIWVAGEGPFVVQACKPLRIEDPTGCGDAFRSGFLHGYCRGWDPLDSARLGSVMGSFAIEHFGGQNHAPTLAEIVSRYEQNFGNYPKTAAASPKP